MCRPRFGEFHATIQYLCPIGGEVEALSHLLQLLVRVDRLFVVDLDEVGAEVAAVRLQDKANVVEPHERKEEVDQGSRGGEI